VQKYDQLESSNRYNHAILGFPSFIVKKQDKSQEGEQGWLLPTTCPPIMVKPRTVCCQEGENDEDISNLDLIVLTTSKLKVKPFYMGFIFNRCYDLMLHLEVYTFSFLELLTWIKRGLDCIWTAWRVNEVDWGPCPSTPSVLHRATTSPLA
jgi:hypothetical protein